MPESNDLLFEIGTEELPPTALKRLSKALTDEFIKGLDEAQLSHGSVHSYATPRRLALVVNDCAMRQPDRDVERRGPGLQAAFDGEGQPTKAAQGFARSCGVTVADLAQVNTDKGDWLVHKMHEAGRTAAELLPGIADNALGRLPIPKRMRWGSSEVQFVRPVHWVVFLHGKQVVECELLGVRAGDTTRGHRFHHPAPIQISAPANYGELLQTTGKVIADFAERREHIVEMVTVTAGALGGRADMDPALLDEVTALNEWPVPIAGRFEERFLDVPHEALVATMKGNQKYFPLFDTQGNLLNCFITVANIQSTQPDLIRAGNERVVRPRLSDAMFFWQQDAKQTLESRRDALKDVVFQQKLGSMFDKSERVATVAQEIAAAIGGDVLLAQRAARLSRCDLLTSMVFEFPEMQGIMGRYQARRDGEAGELATALDEFYMPRFSGDQIPQTPTGIAISLAEKLDSLIGIFAIGMRPTGDKDPFALRRAALGALRILREHSLTLDIKEILLVAEKQFSDFRENEGIAVEVFDFMLERLKGLYVDLGYPLDIFEAVSAVKPRSIKDFEARMVAVKAFREMPEAGALAGANKRITNILRKVVEPLCGDTDSRLFQDDAERELAEAIAEQRAAVSVLLSQEDYTGALRRLAGLHGSVDHFFDAVMVMAEDEKVRKNRLTLLAELRGLFLEVADLSLLQG